MAAHVDHVRDLLHPPETVLDLRRSLDFSRFGSPARGSNGADVPAAGLRSSLQWEPGSLRPSGGTPAPAPKPSFGNAASKVRESYDGLPDASASPAALRHASALDLAALRRLEARLASCEASAGGGSEALARIRALESRAAAADVAHGQRADALAQRVGALGSALARAEAVNGALNARLGEAEAAAARVERAAAETGRRMAALELEAAAARAAAAAAETHARDAARNASKAATAALTASQPREAQHDAAWAAAALRELSDDVAALAERAAGDTERLEAGLAQLATRLSGCAERAASAERTASTLEAVMRVEVQARVAADDAIMLRFDAAAAGVGGTPLSTPTGARVSVPGGWSSSGTTAAAPGLEARVAAGEAALRRELEMSREEAAEALRENIAAVRAACDPRAAVDAAAAASAGVAGLNLRVARAERSAEAATVEAAAAAAAASAAASAAQSAAAAAASAAVLSSPGGALTPRSARESRERLPRPASPAPVPDSDEEGSSALDPVPSPRASDVADLLLPALTGRVDALEAALVAHERTASVAASALAATSDLAAAAASAAEAACARVNAVEAAAEALALRIDEVGAAAAMALATRREDTAHATPAHATPALEELAGRCDVVGATAAAALARADAAAAAAAVTAAAVRTLQATPPAPQPPGVAPATEPGVLKRLTAVETAVEELWRDMAQQDSINREMAAELDEHAAALGVAAAPPQQQ
jgi:hypothetical protein